MRVSWVDPGACDPPHGVTHPGRLEGLRRAFSVTGWDPACPALVGYPEGDRVQLLSGSHRWRAALDAGLDRIPVVLLPRHRVWDAFGDVPVWLRAMEAPAAGHPRRRIPT